jgi:glycosyl hydrolase family 16
MRRSGNLLTVLVLLAVASASGQASGPSLQNNSARSHATEYDSDNHGRCDDSRNSNEDHRRTGTQHRSDCRSDDHLLSISGIITPEGAGAGAMVYLGGSLARTTIADRHGRYKFVGLRRGAYLVTPTQKGYAFAPSSQFVRITTSKAKGVDFSASPTHALSGILTPAVGGARITLTGSRMTYRITTSNSAGAYRFTDLADGEYIVTPSKPGLTFTPLSRSVTLNGADLTGVHFSVGENVLFFDDFSGESIDSTRWTLLNREGDQNNAESHCYQPANVTLSGGNLQIDAKVQPIECDGKTYNYTSGMAQWTSFNFTYGTIEVRAKMAAGRGPWAALWLLGADCQASNIISANNQIGCNWPQPGSDEIDIAEIIGGNLSNVWQNVISGTSGFQTCTPPTIDAGENWHTYTLDWAPGSLIWKIDGTQTCTFTENIPSTPMFLMMNVAVGGSGGPVDDSTLPQTMLVDYVKVVQK